MRFDVAAGNLRLFHDVRFVHDLFTTTSATDCARGGILRIPYFWHWVTPNPRHDILSLPDSVALGDLPPPEPFDRYQTYADIDRVPALYLGDLLSEQPRYTHPGCGSFYTFGWCSEREMAFVALLGLLGLEGKIVQSGIHTYSVLWCSFRGASTDAVVLAAVVDNTYDLVRWERIPAKTNRGEWLGQVGEGTQIRWYNRQARSPETAAKLRTFEVPAAAADHIRARVREALEALPSSP